MRNLRSIRILARLLVYGLLAGSALLVTSSWWLPWTLPSLLRVVGLEVRAVERLETGRLLLSDLSYASDAVRGSLSSLEVPAPQQYLWERWRGDFTRASLLQVKGLSVQMLGGEAEPEALEPAERSEPFEVARQVREALEAYGAWVPALLLEDCSLRSARGDLLLQLPMLRLRDWQLSVLLEPAGLPEALDTLKLEAVLEPSEAWTAQVLAPAAGLDLQLLLQSREAGLELNFELSRATERVVGQLSFSAGTWLPLRASLQSERLSIDPAWLPTELGQYLEEAALSQLNIDWEQGAYTGALKLQGAVVPPERASLPVSGALKFSGDLERLRVDVLRFFADSGQLHLNQPLEIDLRDGSVSERAAFQANFDLSQQAFVPATGQVDMRLSVVPSLTGGPNVRFDLSAVDLSYETYALARVDLEGRLEGSLLTLDTAALQPASADAGVVELSGQTDLSTEVLDFKYKLALAPDSLNAMLEPLVLSGALNGQGVIVGDWDRPRLEGDFDSLTLQYPNLKPITVSANYQSEGWQQWSVDASAAAGGARIEASLLTRAEQDRVLLELSRLRWSDPVRPTLELPAPAQFSYRFGGEAEVPESRFVLEDFRLLGVDSAIELAWSSASGLDLQVQNVSSQRLESWVAAEFAELSIDSVALALPALRPHLQGDLELHLEMRAAATDSPVNLRVDAKSQWASEGLVADLVQLQFDNAPLLQGTARAPLRLRIPEAGGAFWELLAAGPLAVHLNGTVTPSFADWLSDATGVQLAEASLAMSVAGTIEQPSGRLELAVGSLETGLMGVPAMDQIQLLATAESDRVELEQFKFVVNQSEVSGRLSLPTEGMIDALRGTRQARLAWLSMGSGRIELLDWQAENWVEYLPALMRRSGRVSGSLELQPELDLTGRLSFQDFALRPTESLPSIDLIQGELQLAQRRLTARGASAQVGGSRVEFSGWLDAGDWRHPLWDFSISGENVPLVRTTDMILRSDLDLQAIHTEAGAVPIVQGDLNLRSSTMLVEFDPLASKVETGPQSQPPYFSISEPAIADWRFDLKIAGNSFMRVRSPYFRTQLSANFDLGGTFAEPFLIGSVRTVDGELSFPGAKLRITGGEAYIEPGQPHAVQLNFNGIAQKASYVITMDVTQTLQNPHIHFQSTPTLSNASIVRLLTTGSASGGGVGSVGLYLGQGLLGAGGMDDQLADRLTVDVGEETSRSGRNTVGVRYELSDDVFLEGGYDVYDAYNLDLIWSLFRR